MTKKGEQYPAEPLSDKDVNRLLRSFDVNTAAGVRDKAICCLMLGAGLRIAEALAVQEANLREDRGVLLVRNGKGGKSAWVPAPKWVFAQIGRWIKRREQFNFPDDAPLFCTIPHMNKKGGRPVHRENYRKVFVKRAKEAGVEGRVHCHALRHTCAVNLVTKDDFKPHEVQRVMRHSSLKRTQIYLDHVVPDDLATKMNARKWAYG